MSDESTKAALKEALKEWLDEQVTKLGWSIIKWFATGLAVLAAYFIINFKLS